MKNIIWEMPDGRLGYHLLADDADSELEAAILVDDKRVAEDWKAVAFDRVLPETDQELWRFVDGEIVTLEGKP